MKSNWFKRTMQTISYLPHFISMVVACGIVDVGSPVRGGRRPINQWAKGGREDIRARFSYSI